MSTFSRSNAAMYAALWLAAVLLCLAACSRPSASVKEYALKGEIVSLDAQTQSATIRHEKIDGWMEAMTMEFPVKDKAEFQALKAGDRITATVFVRGSDYWVGRIQHQP